MIWIQSDGFHDASGVACILLLFHANTIGSHLVMYSLSCRLQTTYSFAFDYKYEATFRTDHCVFTANEHPGVHNTIARTTSLINVNHHADRSAQTASVPHRSV